MPEWLLKVKDFPRRNRFPFRVEQVFHCTGKRNGMRPKKWDGFEVCIRLSSGTDSTEDIVNGEYLKMPCPNVVWRLPGSVWSQPQPSIRNVISFGYPPEVLETMDLLGMKVENIAWNFAMSSELEMLIAKFNRTVYNLYTPGAADTLDWVCFCLMATLRLQENMSEPDVNMGTRIRNVSIWFRSHFAEKIDIDEVAEANGFSHDHFFKTWKKHFELTPAQFINNLRLEAAAQRLQDTDIAISEIIREVHFAGEYMFYRCFRQKFGMTPAEYRQLHKTGFPAETKR